MARPLSGKVKKRPVNLTLEPSVEKAARAYMKRHHIGSMSEFVAALFREKIEETEKVERAPLLVKRATRHTAETPSAPNTVKSASAKKG